MRTAPLLLLPLIVVVLVVVGLIARSCCVWLIAGSDVLVVVAVLLSSIVLIVALSSVGKRCFLFIPLQLVHGVSSRTSFMRIAAGITKTAIAMANPSNAEISIRLLAWRLR